MSPQQMELTSAQKAESILHELSIWQHLRPHDAIAQVVSAVGERLGVCPNASAEAMAWLQIDAHRRIGRFQRTELHQLARAIHRHWHRAANASPSEPHKA
jgi:hypothetical protein